MQQYVYDIGLEAGKIMNCAYSIRQVFGSAASFLSGGNMVLQSKAIYPFYRALPRQSGGLTGSLFLQGTIAKSFESNTYFGTTGSSETENQLMVTNNLKIIKMQQFVTGSKIVLRNQYVYDFVTGVNIPSAKPSFYLNTTNYKDDSSLVFCSYKTTRNGEESSIIGFTADSYNTHFGQTNFASKLENQSKNAIKQFNFSSGSIESSFESIVLQCANF